jgi:transposase
VRAIARKLSVDESTLRYRLSRHRRSAQDGRAGKAEACDPHEAVIAAWLGGQAEARRPESVKVLYETLVREHGYGGSYKAVLRYVRRRSAPPPIRPARRVETRPGAQAQVDWGRRAYSSDRPASRSRSQPSSSRCRGRGSGSCSGR